MAFVREGDIKFSNQGVFGPADTFLDGDGTDFLREPGMETVVELLLGTQARALDTDVLPDRDTSKRGWWGSELMGFNLGSRSWVIGEKAKMNTRNIKAIEQLEAEALQPMVEQDMADDIVMKGTRDPNNANKILMQGQIIKKDGGGVFFSYFLNWKYQITGSL